MRLLGPWFLHHLLLLPPLVLCTLRRGGEQAVRYSSNHAVAHLPESIRLRLERLPLVIRIRSLGKHEVGHGLR